MNDYEDIRLNITRQIIKNIPPKMKPTEYLMETLHLSRVSVYRRLKGIIPFSYDEVALLAKKLNFSVDAEIHRNSRDKYIIDYGNYFTDDAQTVILKVLNKHYTMWLTEQKMEKRNLIEIANFVWFIYTVNFENLFKFYFYKTTHQYDLPSLKKKMKDIEIPDHIEDLRKKVGYLVHNMDNTVRTTILDRHLFFNTMSDIQYYYRRGLLQDDELKLVTQDMEMLLYYLEKIIIEGDGKAHQYYLSKRNIYVNSSSIENDDQLYCMSYETIVTPIMCFDQAICRMQRNYLESFKKQSILISNSYDELQVRFFEKQAEYVRMLAENRDLDM